MQCRLRALHRIAPDLDWDDPRLLKAAYQVAWGFSTLFNQHDAIALLRKDDDDRYWHRVLTYSVEHNLQALFDEYVHYLVDAEGLGARSSAERVAGVSVDIFDALSIRPSQIDIDDPIVEGQKLVINKFQMRGRFAMRLGRLQGRGRRSSASRKRASSLQFAVPAVRLGDDFSRPRGARFHPYCYRIYHWNLAVNPVDLEQREGRVHRFKGHAIRLNLAHRQDYALRGRDAVPDDPWQAMFDAARAETDIDTDLIPYWISRRPRADDLCSLCATC